MNTRQLSDRRNALLREMFHLIRLSEDGITKTLLMDKNYESEALERFLERFDLRKKYVHNFVLACLCDFLWDVAIMFEMVDYASFLFALWMLNLLLS